MMAIVAVVLSILIAVLGVVSVVAPNRLAALVRSFQTRAGLYTAAAIRIVLGISLVFAAPGSLAPGTIWIIGIVIFVAGLITPVIGLERFRKLTDWWLDRGPWFARIWGAVAFLLGLLLAWTVAPWGRTG
jgi:hypothetical protein